MTFNNTIHSIPPVHRREILTISVEITEGQSADILIREGDDPAQLANEFAQRYGISRELRDLLAE
jgi:hypothetical protein